MDEPALFVPQQSTMPGDVVHPGGGEPRLHSQVHNLYGSLMARFTAPDIAAVGGRIHVSNANDNWLSRMQTISPLEAVLKTPDPVVWSN